MIDILVVDDNRWFADILIARLRPRCTVRWCDGAQAAIEAVDQCMPQAVVLDMLMPGANGAVFLQELRSYDDTASLPVVICSSVPMSKQIEALRVYGVQAVFDKATLDFDELEAILARLTTTGHISAELAKAAKVERAL